MILNRWALVFDDSTLDYDWSIIKWGESVKNWHYTCNRLCVKWII